MITFTTFILWLHLAAIALWVGGLFSVAFVSVPVLRREIDSPGDSARLVQIVVARFQRVSREVLLIILLTGAFNLLNAGMAHDFHFTGSYLRLLGTKITLFLVMVAIQIWQTYRLAPALDPAASGDTDRHIRRYYLTSVINLVLAVTVILMGLKLRYGG